MLNAFVSYSIQGILRNIIINTVFSDLSKELVAEKQTRLKESMKMMGLSNWMHWAAWFIKVMAFFLIIIIMQTILLKVSELIF